MLVHFRVAQLLQGSCDMEGVITFTQILRRGRRVQSVAGPQPEEQGSLLPCRTVVRGRVSPETTHGKHRESGRCLFGCIFILSFIVGLTSFQLKKVFVTFAAAVDSDLQWGKEEFTNSADRVWMLRVREGGCNDSPTHSCAPLAGVAFSGFQVFKE